MRFGYFLDCCLATLARSFCNFPCFWQLIIWLIVTKLANNNSSILDQTWLHRLLHPNGCHHCCGAILVILGSTFGVLLEVAACIWCLEITLHCSKLSLKHPSQITFFTILCVSSLFCTLNYLPYCPAITPPLLRPPPTNLRTEINEALLCGRR